MRDLPPGLWMWIKAGLFVVIGLSSAGLLLWRDPEWTTLLLVALCVWAFCRAYYFAFYVIEKYLDPTCRFSGLGSVIVYFWRQRRRR